MPAMETFTGTRLHFVVPPCQLTSEDLRRLAAKMEEFATEAADREVAGMRIAEGQTEEQFELERTRTREMLTLIVQVHSDRGEWKAGPWRDVLGDDALPDVMTRVTFDTAIAMHAVLGRGPTHALSLVLNLNRRNILDFGNADDVAEQFMTGASIQTRDTVWAYGVQEGLKKFFAERRTLWGWLHGKLTYSVLVMLVGLPVAFLWLSRADAWISATHLTESSAIRVGILLYVVFLLLYGFRIIFNLLCRVFPRIKGPRGGTGGWFGEGLWLALTLATWFSTLFLDWLRGLLQSPR